jgi:replicative DNA helicase
MRNEIHESPADVEIEQSVLATALILPESIDEIKDSLDKSAFYRTGHQRIIEAIFQIHDAGGHVDAVTVASKVKDNGFQDLAPASMIAGLLDQPVSPNLEYHIRVLREKAAMRRVIEICNAGFKRAADSTKDPMETLDYVKDEIDAIEIDPNLNKNMKSVADLAGDTIERYEAISSGEIQPGIKPGFKKLNELTTFQPGDIIFLAARPSMGKTALALNILLNCNYQDRIPRTAVFSLEQSREQLMDRLVAIKTRLDLKAIGDALFDQTGWSKVQSCLGWLFDQPIYIDDTPGLTVQDIRSRARRLHRKHGLEFIIIDYLQLMKARSRKDGNRNLEVGEICVQLKGLAKDLGVPVLVVSQLSRALEKRPNPNKIPMLSDLRDSGEIEQVADKVMFIYRPEVYNDTENTEFDNQANVYLAKQRQGPTGKARLRLDLSSVRFDDVELHHREAANGASV